jgi:hypothetical protein
MKFELGIMFHFIYPSGIKMKKEYNPNFSFWTQEYSVTDGSSSSSSSFLLRDEMMHWFNQSPAPMKHDTWYFKNKITNMKLRS